MKYEHQLFPTTYFARVNYPALLHLPFQENGSKEIGLDKTIHPSEPQKRYMQEMRVHLLPRNLEVIQDRLLTAVLD